MKNKLKIGIIINSYLIPSWSFKMLEEIEANTGSEIVLIVNKKSENIEKKNLLTKIIENRKQVLYILYKKLDWKIFSCNPNALDSKDIRNIQSINSLKTIDILDQFDENNIKRINDSQIDIFIDLGFKNLPGDILKTTRLGIWSIKLGDKKASNNGPKGIWEIIKNKNETKATLQILNGNLDKTFQLTRSYSATHNHSLNKSINSFYGKALYFIPSKIQELSVLGEELFFQKIAKSNQQLQFYSNKQNTTPTNIEMIFFGVKTLFRTIKNKIEKTFFYNQWILLFRMSSSRSISKAFYQYKKIIPPKDRFWADPHIIQRNDKYYIFLEELIYQENKGHISMMEMDDDGNWTKPVIVLKEDFHLSYPFLIEDNGVLYMIPESENNNSIRLYKCVNFPLEWSLEKILIDNIVAADTTILLKNRKYWMFANVSKLNGTSNIEELHLFSSDHLVSDNWTSHPQNPIVADVKQSRPAGKFFTYKDKLYRPSQNCSKHYGYGMKINEVVELNEKEYQEKVVDSIFPDWDKKIVSTHTINSVGRLTIIDAQMKRRRYFRRNDHKEYYH
ncbi:MAG TPA: hypothetical protein VFC65_00680 [Prolixibacteraceae bacterium]|nr:hypothetical protein [Prolixibacteraceae bacterium]